ncbi:MAG TPA: tetratricopeptide repeat protein [Bacteroidia bacterium]|nr:tetratricopeptide repeat protein [Bacteroidia bacterium]
MTAVEKHAETSLADQGHSSGSFEKNEKWIVWGILLFYCIASIAYGFLSPATWDDDCPTRYYNTLAAFEHPKNFIDIWNRPLFVILFALPVQISKYGILVLMVLITAFAAHALYKALKEIHVKNAFMVLPFLLFQAFFFGLSRNAETEPLAAALMCLGFLCYVRKNFLWFAILGGLLPLARVELAVLLAVWAVVILKHSHWKYLLILALPTFLWNLAGFIAEGDPLWLLHQVQGDGANRYLAQPFVHYFQRYIYVLGPVVFYYFFLGVWDRLLSQKTEMFIFWQFIVGFLLYVLISWKLTMGDSAGFLRNLIPLSPLAAVLAVYGYNMWLRSPEEKISVVESAETDSPVEKNNPKKKRDRKVPVAEKSQEHPAENNGKGRIILVSLLVLVLTWFFFSWQMEVHHKLMEESNYTNFIVIAALFVLFLVTLATFRNTDAARKVKQWIAAVLILGTTSFTLITEKWDAHMNPERDIMTKVSDLYVDSYLSGLPTYANHIWFYWCNDLERSDDKFKTVTKENLRNAPLASIVIWETHYSHRLGGDVQLDSIQRDPTFIELFQMSSTDSKIHVFVFQKVKADGSDMLARYAEAVKAFPNMANLYMNRGNAKIRRLGDMQGGLEDYSKVVSLEPLNAEGYFNQGVALFNMRNHEAAVAAFRKSMELKPDNAEASFNIGVVYGTIKNYKEAIANYTEAIKINDRHAKAYKNRAEIAVELNDYSNALFDYANVIRINPYDADAYVSRGTIYAKLKDKEKAMLDFNQAIAIQPGNPKGHFQKGMLLADMGQQAEACASFNAALQLGFEGAAPIMAQYCK